jgi:hypothetical protein
MENELSHKTIISTVDCYFTSSQQKENNSSSRNRSRLCTERQNELLINVLKYVLPSDILPQEWNIWNIGPDIEHSKLCFET